MAIQIGAKLDSGFNDPIGMLKDCHRRIESFLGILCLVVERAQGRTLTDEERDGIESALDISERVDNATQRMRSSRFSHGCAKSLLMRWSKSIALRKTIVRRTTFTIRSSGLTQYGLNAAV